MEGWPAGRENVGDAFPLPVERGEEYPGDQLFLHPWEPNRETFNPIENYDPENGGMANKGRGGLWTSTLYEHEETGEPWSDWCRWCAGERWGATDKNGTSKAWALRPHENVQVAVIDTVEDAHRWRQAGILRLMELGGQIFHGMWEIDFEALAEAGIDGLRLTEEGQWRTRIPEREVPSLYGWDSESTCWFRWAFTETRDLGRIELYNPDETLW